MRGRVQLVFNKFLPSVCMSVCVSPIVARQWLRKIITTAKNTLTTIEELLDASFYIFFLDFPIYLQSVEIHSANGVLGNEGGSRSALAVRVV
jgi:hypothetical protein